MKKQYIQPESHIVVVKLIGSVLEDPGLGTDSQGARSLGSRQSDDRFDWGAADEEEEHSAELPQTPW